MAKWYRVDEKKPRTRRVQSVGRLPGDVIYYRESDPILVYYYETWTKGMRITRGYFSIDNDGTEHWEAEGAFDGSTVTHWMRMPKPPKEDLQ